MKEKISSYSHSEVIRDIKGLIKLYQKGSVSKKRILEFVYHSRKETQMSRSVYLGQLSKAGIEEGELYNIIQNIDNYETNQEQINIETENTLTEDKVEWIISQMQANPRENIYNILTQKIKEPKEYSDPINYIYNDPKLLRVAEETEKFASAFDKKMKGFKGGGWHSKEGNVHEFTNPNGDQINNWLVYTVTPVSEGVNNREDITTRFYLKPKLENLYKVWSDIISLLEKTEEINENGLETKIPNFFRTNDYSAKAKQTDRILFYAGEQSKKVMAKIIAKYCQENKEYFEDGFSLANQMVDSEGEPITGLWTSFSPEKKSFNNMHSNLIEKAIKNFCEYNNIEKLEFVQKMKHEPSKKTFVHYLTTVYPAMLKSEGINPQRMGSRLHQEN